MNTFSGTKTTISQPICDVENNTKVNNHQIEKTQQQVASKNGDEVPEQKVNKQMLLSKKTIEQKLAEKLHAEIQKDFLIDAVDACKTKDAPKTRIETAKNVIKNSIQQKVINENGQWKIQLEIFMGKFLHGLSHHCTETDLVLEGKSPDKSKLTKEIKVSFPQHVDSSCIELRVIIEEETVLVIAPFKENSYSGSHLPSHKFTNALNEDQKELISENKSTDAQISSTENDEHTVTSLESNFGSDFLERVNRTRPRKLTEDELLEKLHNGIR